MITAPIKNPFSQNRLFIISGPCSLENEKLATQVCRKIKKICHELDIDFIFKASFDKANRSSIYSYRGPGLEGGLKILNKIKEEEKVKILSDVHTPEMVIPCAEVLDIIQIPAFLARQTDFYIEVGKTKKPLNVKKGQFMSPYEVKNIIDKFRESGGKNIAITERGSTFGYQNLVVDYRSIKIIKDLGVPYIYDASHSLQLPAAQGKESGGQKDFLETLLFGQISAGADGVFIETHPNPSQALSDKKTQYPLKKMKKLLKQVKGLYDFRKKKLGF